MNHFLLTNVQMGANLLGCVLGCVHTRIAIDYMKNLHEPKNSVEIFVPEFAESIDLKKWATSKKLKDQLSVDAHITLLHLLNRDGGNNVPENEFSNGGSFQRIHDLPALFLLSDINSTENVFSVKDFDSESFRANNKDSTPRLIIFYL